MTARKAAFLETSRLGWYTRGLHWDYTIICRPTTPDRSGWFDLLEQLFTGVEVGETAKYYRGDIQWEDSDRTSSPYAAVTFLDPDRHDRDQRGIKHFLFYLARDDEFDGLGDGWHLSLLSELTSSYDQVFALEATDLAPKGMHAISFDEQELLRRFRTKLPDEVQITSIMDSPPEWKSKDIDLRRQVPSKVRPNWPVDNLPKIARPVQEVAILAVVIVGILVGIRLLWHSGSMHAVPVAPQSASQGPHPLPKVTPNSVPPDPTLGLGPFHPEVWHVPLR